MFILLFFNIRVLNLFVLFFCNVYTHPAQISPWTHFLAPFFQLCSVGGVLVPRRMFI
jgi:hypothetical protein